MNLNPTKLIPEETLFLSSLNGSRARGSYSTMQFVLRLRDDVRTILDEEQFDQEWLKANSTALHENIHWWQNIGSNFGFLLSLANPGFSSMCIDHFKGLVGKKMLYKPLIEFDKQYHDKYQKADINEINIILNTYFDFEYAKRFMFDNKNFEKIYEDKRFFLNMGHCYHVFWSKGINTIASTTNKGYEFLPDVGEWIPNFQDLSNRKVEGFFIESPMTISPLGIKAIYEGQAIFNQLQYLTLVLDENLGYQDFKDQGMLHGMYLEAFELYLHVTGFMEPANLLDPVVGLFLLVCDMSINPTNGFPVQVYDYENFIVKNDPGIRFTLLCKEIKTCSEYYLDLLKEYSKEEYIKIEAILSKKLGYKSAYDELKSVLKWFDNPEIVDLLQEESVFKYANYNLPIRVLFSKFLRFQEDKYLHPNVFCWFGLYASSKSTNVEYEIVQNLYKKHHALFIDDYDNEVKPVIFEGVEEENISETFNAFYQYFILLDMILKWVNEKGEFKFDYKWLSNKSADEMIPVIKEDFAKMFKISPNDITIL
ncbi:hypothetical protein [Dyadobacter pollutisoli]|jgi:hypothetical protein|uniref:Uncharacterized protein n=1 Tax=Dyadobacter pollutisoli TaxID=2910158 RepID=A0A9E8N7P3_9BACT|nr:hypothetical protein [Dyadobacter pollutisoli]WAC11419.1 hypothetical protein ON006_27260 [Dyadobacter pollutisoli]